MYEQEYNTTKTKDEFMKLMRNRYAHLKENSISRVYYTLRKRLGEQKEVVQFPKVVNVRTEQFPSNEKTQPHSIKLLLFNDMKRYKIKLTRAYLTKYGFIPAEINWLIDNGEEISE